MKMKKLLSSLFALTMITSISGCTNASANVSSVAQTKTETKETKKDDADTKAAKETINGYFTAFQEGDIDSLQDYCTDNFNEDNDMEGISEYFDQLKTEAAQQGIDQAGQDAFDALLKKAVSSTVRKYEITEIEKKNDRIKATVKIEGIPFDSLENVDTEDIQTALEEKYKPLVQAAGSEEEVNSLMAQLFTDWFNEIGNKVDKIESEKTNVRVTLINENDEWLIDKLVDKGTDTSSDTETKKEEKKEESKDSQKVIAADKSGNLKVTEAGYQVTESKYANGVIVVQNDNKKRAYENAEVKVTAYDTDDKVLSTSSAYIVSIQPGEKQAYYYTIDTNDETISRIEYKVKAKETVSPDNKRAKSSDFEFIGTNERIDEEYGDSSITGTLKNNSKQDVEFLELTVVFKKDGNVVGGYTTYADDLEAGDETSFEINAYDAPEHDAYELYAVNHDYK